MAKWPSTWATHRDNQTALDDVKSNHDTGRDGGGDDDDDDRGGRGRGGRLSPLRRWHSATAGHHVVFD
eukprot:CAMPEP_0182537326 /NCGR_PEP_ID=MMETSP1323-20130603/21747_1 /TAXON_ID=236787 /ORGANISM="Florenciella parvula, Strain RCC1693" /LENGTH=67 /DNA_ID=CAMNT_0024747687 /DNA_START=312 /DNA_END=513 /DNA_ORIENTATION=+